MLLKTNQIFPLSLLISESIIGNRKMQEILYNQFAFKMYYVCLRYAKNASDAEDILQEGFIKIFRNLDKFKGDGSFEGWVRKIMSRTALSHLRDNKKNTHLPDTNICFEDKECNVLDRLEEKDLIGIVTKLPPGYRKVFMMYVIDGYNHREIATILGCSESNCKSQLYRSRTQLKKMLKKIA